MKDTVKGKNCRVEIIDNIESENVLLNIFFNTGMLGEFEQVILPRNKAKALAYILLGDN